LPLLSRRNLLHEAEIRCLRGLCANKRLARADSPTSTHTTDITRVDSLSREQLIRQAVLLLFRDPMPSQCLELFNLSGKEWRRLLYWLDVSGLALYLFDRLFELGLRERMPQAIVDRLQQNTIDNAKRTKGMVEESVAIQREFQQAGLSYSVIKGLSLCPDAVLRPELRHQFDLDFLVAEKSISEARQILERRGYRLYAVSGKSWEFKINETPYGSLEKMYKGSPEYAVELHVESEAASSHSRLSRIRHREMYGIFMPVLSPVDLFLGQGLHAFKDVCSAFSRTAHLLEFYRHVIVLRDDAIFWTELRSKAECDPRASLGIGVVTYLLTSIMGDFAPKTLTDWTVQTLPLSVQLWVNLYGRRTVFGKPPGTKLYLLLQRELENAGVPGKHSIKRALLPSRLPPPVVRGSSSETLSVRIARYRLQCRVIFSRLGFHAMEGLRYALESYRWRQSLKRLS
jgi:Uncharacterised nucleotidyltransferase